MNELPSTSSGSNYDDDEDYRLVCSQNNDKHLVEDAKRLKRLELREKREERERSLQERIRQREREMRLQNLHRDVAMAPGRNAPLDDPYDSSESGYWSIKDRRPHSRTRQMWEIIRNSERRLREKKELQKKEEDKQELDAMFHVMLHGSDELVVSDGSEYEYKLPEFMKFDEIKRGFDEQMKRENAIKKQREDAEKRAAASNEDEPMKQEQIKPTTSSFKNLWGQSFSGYNFPPINTDWSMESNATIKKGQQPQQKDNEVIMVYASSDEEDNSTTAITKRAMKWSICSPRAIPSVAGPDANNNCTATSSAIITIHDSDSE